MASSTRPILRSSLYSDPREAEKDLKAALVKAGAEGKRVIVVFGGNWCYDCHVPGSPASTRRTRHGNSWNSRGPVAINYCKLIRGRRQIGYWQTRRHSS